MADDFIAEDRGEATERFIYCAMRPYSYLGGPIAYRRSTAPGRARGHR
jgi:hypothetical protein